MRRVSFALLCSGVALGAVAGVVGQSAPQPSALAPIDWPVYRGTPGGTQYVPVAQINAANVHTLRPAWTYHTGDGSERSNMHVNPIVVNGRMYITTPTLRAVALDAATGRELWTFDPARYNNGTVIRLRNRGVAYWKGAEGERIFHFVRDRAYAIDAGTGALITSFGNNGYHRPAPEPGRRSRNRRARDDVTRCGVRESSDSRVAGQ